MPGAVETERAYQGMLSSEVEVQIDTCVAGELRGGGTAGRIIKEGF